MLGNQLDYQEIWGRGDLSQVSRDIPGSRSHVEGSVIVRIHMLYLGATESSVLAGVPCVQSYHVFDVLVLSGSSDVEVVALGVLFAAVCCVGILFPSPQ